MKPERYAELKRAFLTVRARPDAERATALRAACGADVELARGVEDLLAVEVEMEDNSFGALDAPALGAGFALKTPEVHAPEEQLERTGLVLGGYRIVELIGAGAFAAVYRARREFERPGIPLEVALKLPREARATAAVWARFEHEARVLAALRQRGIVRLLDSSATRRQATQLPFLALELVRGRTLAPHTLPRRAGMRLLAELCDAVDHAHERGCLHGDLKPSNVIVDERGEPKLIDFGTARELAPRRQPGAPGPVPGTPPYLAPECRGLQPAPPDRRADVHALGVLGTELFRGAQDRPASDSDRRWSARIARVLRRAGSRRPERRPASARALAEELRAGS